LADWAKWIAAQPADVFCYIKHDEEAPLLANRLLQVLRTG